MHPLRTHVATHPPPDDPPETLKTRAWSRRGEGVGEGIYDVFAHDTTL
jgi:hypothetical protein